MLKQTWLALALAVLVLLPGCITEEDGNAPGEEGGVELSVWHSFAAESKEEAAFRAHITAFEAANPGVMVDVTGVPFAEADRQFMIAAQGGEAPDLVRLSSDQLGKIGDVRVSGQPLLEDLRPHLTPNERSSFDVRALHAMRYEGALLGLPASQDCLSLFYNPLLFDAAGVGYPDASWTHEDLLQAAMDLTAGDVQGLAMPVKDAYWWFGFQAGFGGALFDANGTPTLDSNGSAEAMRWVVGLEQVHGVVLQGTQSESMKTQFLSSKAAMIVDGPWNWATYEAGRIPVQQTLLPTVGIDGDRIAPLVTYKGWSVAKQSEEKVWATKLALHLSSAEVQRTFALETYTLPTHVEVYDDPAVVEDPVLSGFLEQLMVGTPAPTTRGMALVYDPLVSAFENVYAGTMEAEEALRRADEALEADLAEAAA